MGWQDAPVIGGPQVTDDLLDRLRSTESGGDPSATSKKGAVGPYQFMPATFQSMGLTEAQARDESVARPHAKDMLQRLVDKYGSIEKGLAAYNWGEGNVDKYGMGKAPTETKKYVAKILGKEKEKTESWKTAPLVEEEPQTISSIVGKYIPTSVKRTAEATLSDTAALADMMLSLPAAALGVAKEMEIRATGIAKGEERSIVEKAGKMAREEAMQKYGNPIAKFMTLAGFKGGYEQSDVTKALNTAAGWLAKGGEWVEKNTHGVLTATDVDALTNELMVVGGARATAAGASKIVGKMLEPKPEVPAIRLDPKDESPTPSPKATPATLAKEHIERNTGIKDVAERDTIRKQQRSDARAAFAADPAYADYLKNYADEEVRQRSVAAEKAAEMEKGSLLDTALLGKPQPQVTWNEALPILKKPGFQRTPEDMVKLRAFQKQAGKADPMFLARLAVVGVTGAAMYNIDPEHPLIDTALALGAGFAAGAPVKTAALIKNLFKPDERIRATKLFDDHEVRMGRAARDVWQHVQDVAGLVPDAPRREAVTNWMQGDKSIPITQQEMVAAQKARAFFDALGQTAMQEDVLHGMIPDYVTNLWDLTGKNKTNWDRIASNMSTESRFDLQRKITSIAMGKRLGLIPVTEDISQIMSMYGNSMYKTMANKQLLASLKNQQISPGSRATLVMPVKDAPSNYVKMDHPQLIGMAVHPEIAPSMRFVFHSSHPLAITKALEGVNIAIKRNGVSLSLFHANSLLMAGVGAGINPLKVIGYLKGTDQYLQQLRKGGIGDMVDRSIRGGLKVTYDKGPLAVEDVGEQFYQGMDVLGKWADQVVPYGGAPIRGLENINRSIDHLMWSRLHAGLKLNTFAKEVERLTTNNTAAHMRDPRMPLKSAEDIDKIAASYTNDVFGGINWRRVAEEAKTAWGRDFKLSAMSPQGRRILQLAMFAPDWTVSVSRSFLKQFTAPGSGLKGLIKPTELADLHRRYYIRNALFWATAGDGLNYALSGHHIWENGQYHQGHIDWTMIDMGDGRYIPWNKHSMEPAHWAMNPFQEAANKLGYIPAEGIEQVTGKQYISASGHAPAMDITMAGRTEHAIKHAMPFAIQKPDISPESIEAAGSGAMGWPIYGTSDERRAELKLQKARERELAKLLGKRKKKE